MFLQINGIKINYKVSGNGNNIILLHGWGGEIGSFGPVHGYLEKNFRVFSIDLPGFGLSEDPPEPWGVGDYATLVESFMQQLQVDNPILIGHSFGGRIAIYLASRIKVNKLILVNSAGIKPRRRLEYFAKVYRLKTIFQSFKEKLGLPDNKEVSKVMQKTLIKVVDEDLKFLLPKLNVPTLLIWGENDTATPVEDGKVMEQLIPDAALVILREAGHFSYLEKPHQFIIEVRNFLKNDLEGTD